MLNALLETIGTLGVIASIAANVIAQRTKAQNQNQAARRQ